MLPGVQPLPGTQKHTCKKCHDTWVTYFELKTPDPNELCSLCFMDLITPPFNEKPPPKIIFIGS